MRRLAVLLLLAAAAVLVPASKADAYRLFKHRWHSKTLTYYDATGGRYTSEIRAAASVLNRSGARVRVRAASRGAARVRISVKGNLRSAGQARYIVYGGVVSRAQILLQPGLQKSWTTPIAARAGVIAVIAHELAHVLGLDHENRRCATMNSRLWDVCPELPAAWQYRCRILQRDDVRGLVRRFGGRARGVGEDLCAAEAAPAAPTGLAATVADPATGAVRVAWAEGLVALAQAEVLRATGACPTGSGEPAARLIARLPSAPGQANGVTDHLEAAGSYCYTVVGRGALGRPGTVASTTVNYLGPPPRAAFSGTWNAAYTVLQLNDLSVDRDGGIVAWAWSFGDGTTSTLRNPAKSWSAPGSYTVTLTVTDDAGQTATSSQPVEISGSNQGAAARSAAAFTSGQAH